LNDAETVDVVPVVVVVLLSIGRSGAGISCAKKLRREPKDETKGRWRRPAERQDRPSAAVRKHTEDMITPPPPS